MTRKELYAAITAAGIKLHPCNLADTAPADDTATYYLDTEELAGIYADIAAEEQTTETTETTETEEEEETMKRINDRYVPSATDINKGDDTMKVNTYGLTMRGLKKAAGETIHYTDRGHIQISYDTETGDVLTDWHPDANSWISYHKTSIIGVTNAYDPMTMQAIADAVRDAVGRWETWH